MYKIGQKFYSVKREYQNHYRSNGPGGSFSPRKIVQKDGKWFIEVNEDLLRDRYQFSITEHTIASIIMVENVTLPEFEKDVENYMRTELCYDNPTYLVYSVPGNGLVELGGPDLELLFATKEEAEAEAEKRLQEAMKKYLETADDLV